MRSFSMGNQCMGTQERSSTLEDPVSGITLREMDLIRYLWLAIYERANLMDTGVLFLRKLFARYPYMRNYFTEFTQESSVDVEPSSAFRAHAISMLAEISKYVDYIEDSEMLISLIKKRTKGHFVYGVTCSDMENVKEVILEFLAERGEGLIELSEALAAWDKLLTFHTETFNEKTAELIKTKKSSMMAVKQAQTSESSIEKSTDTSLQMGSLKSENI